MVMADVLCHMKEKALRSVKPKIFTWATLTGHAKIAHGFGYSVRGVEAIVCLLFDLLGRWVRFGLLFFMLVSKYAFIMLYRQTRACEIASHNAVFSGDPVFLSQCYHSIFWLRVFGNSGSKLHNGIVVSMPYYISILLADQVFKTY